VPFESIELWLTEDTTVPAFERTARLGSDPKIRRCPIFLVRPTQHDPDKATAAEAPSPHPGSGVHSAKLLVGTRQRFSGLSYMRQCGDDVLRMFVTGGLPVRGGAGISHRIVTIAVPVSVLRMAGAG
jgi:hypothetical protein